MLRQSILSIAALFVTAQITLASATSDATYIVKLQMNDLAVASMHIKLKRIFQKKFAHQLGKLGVTVVDADRFAAMLPDTLTDSRVSLMRQTLIASLVKHLTPQQLFEIAEFYRTDTAKKLFAATRARHLREISSSKNIGLYFGGIGKLEQAELSRILTTSELATYTAFSESDATKELRRKVGKIYSPLIGQFVIPRNKELPLNTSYIVEILEADGIVTFKNRILQRDIINRLRDKR